MILVAGDLMLDILLLSDLRASEQSRGILVRGGGSAANTAAWVAYLGAEVIFTGCVGDDAIGAMLIGELRTAGVRTAIRSVHGMETGAVVVEISPSGDRLMRSARGANEALSANDLLNLAASNVTVIHLTGYALLGPAGISLLDGAGRSVSQSDALLSFDPSSPGVIEQVGREHLLTAIASAGVGLLLPNSEEAEALTGAGSVTAAAGSLAQAVPTVIVKTGTGGAVYCAAGDTYSVPTAPLPAVDSTGAGDAFNAGILVARSRGLSIADSCRFAHSVAVQAIVRYGGRPPPTA